MRAVSPQDLRLLRARTALFVGFAVQGLCFATLITQIPEIKAQFGFSDSVVSVILLAVALLAGAGSVLAGLVAGLYGSRMALPAGQVALCLALVGVGFATQTGELYASVGFFGLALGVV